MEMLISLWLPIIVSGVLLFVASFLAWVVLPHHKPEHKRFPDQDALLDLIKKVDPPAAQYMFPFGTDMKGMSEEEKKEFTALWEAGPKGVLNVFGPVNMGMNMVKTTIFFLIASTFIAYLGTLGLEPGASFREVFRFISTAGVLTFSFAGVPNAIWFHRPMLMDILDGIAYGLITGVIFGWMWV